MDLANHWPVIKLHTIYYLNDFTSVMLRLFHWLAL